MGKSVAQEGADFLADVTQDVYEDEMPEWDSEEEEWEDPVDVSTQTNTSAAHTGSTEQLTTVAPQDDIEQQFHQAMVDIYQTAKGELHYKATYFLRMVSELGGLEAAHRLLAKTELSVGFTELYLRDRLDLTVEAHVIKPKFRVLFTPAELKVAEKRLRDMDYELDA